MKKVWNYLKDLFHQVTHFTLKQLILMIVGNLVLALGLTMFNLTGGNHPLHSMLYELEKLTPFSHAVLLMLVSAVIFIFMLFFGKKYIGIGTFVNMFLLGYVMEWIGMGFEALGLSGAGLSGFDFANGNWWLHQIWLIPATLVISLGISLYAGGSMGVAPYDSAPMFTADHTKLKAPVLRILLDGICLVVALILGFLQKDPLYMIGFGTVVTVFLTGPFIAFFDKTVTSKIIGKKKTEAE